MKPPFLPFRDVRRCIGLDILSIHWISTEEAGHLIVAFSCVGLFTSRNSQGVHVSPSPFILLLNVWLKKRIRILNYSSLLCLYGSALLVYPLFRRSVWFGAPLQFIILLSSSFHFILFLTASSHDTRKLVLIGLSTVNYMCIELV